MDVGGEIKQALELCIAPRCLTPSLGYQAKRMALVGQPLCDKHFKERLQKQIKERRDARRWRPGTK